jgi:predicted GTPase
MRDLEATVARCPVDLVLVATPIDLRRIVKIDRPAMRVRYELQEIGTPDLAEVLRPF